MLIRPKFCTERLRLVPCSPRHVDELLHLWSDPDVGRWLWDGREPKLDEVVELVAESTANFAERGFGLWLVEELNGTYVGYAGLREPEWDPGQVELMYGFYPGFWGRGYATEASRVVLERGFDRGLERIVAAVDTPNEASSRVLERLGMTFVREGAIDGLPTRFYSLARAAYEPISAE